jgi:hypothetical protein
LIIKKHINAFSSYLTPQKNKLKDYEPINKHFIKDKRNAKNALHVPFIHATIHNIYNPWFVKWSSNVKASCDAF